MKVSRLVDDLKILLEEPSLRHQRSLARARDKVSQAVPSIGRRRQVQAAEARYKAAVELQSDEKESVVFWKLQMTQARKNARGASPKKLAAIRQSYERAKSYLAKAVQKYKAASEKVNKAGDALNALE